MEKDALSLFGQSQLEAQKAVDSLVALDEVTNRYGLSLSPEQATALVQTRAQTLRATGRVEFGPGILEKLVLAFCDSPYLTSSDYLETLQQLVELFYHFKNETLEEVTDEELLQWMATAFNGSCQGSLELLGERELEELARETRFGDAFVEEELEEAEEEEFWYEQ